MNAQLHPIKSSADQLWPSTVELVCLCSVHPRPSLLPPHCLPASAAQPPLAHCLPASTAQPPPAHTACLPARPSLLPYPLPACQHGPASTHFRVMAPKINTTTYGAFTTGGRLCKLLQCKNAQKKINCLQQGRLGRTCSRSTLRPLKSLGKTDRRALMSARAAAALGSCIRGAAGPVGGCPALASGAAATAALAASAAGAAAAGDAAAAASAASAAALHRWDAQAGVGCGAGQTGPRGFACGILVLLGIISQFL